jgi:phosphoribosylaminoimidazole-succinocarboxamide synthase
VENKKGTLGVAPMKEEIITETNLPLPLLKRGKVRDVYDLKDRLLIVSTDRISAFDVVLPNGIPLKGEALNRLSNYWFERTKKIVANHVLDVVDPRTVLVRKTEPIRIEFVVREYLYGSFWESYTKGRTTGLPRGLKKAEKLANPIFTPTTKAEVGHDTELSKEDVVGKIGRSLAAEIEEASIKIYELASRKAEKSGIIIADTKFEFGMVDQELMLIDECLTPDSSRFWSKAKYRVGQSQFSYDKQYVRDYLIRIGWNKQPPAPKLPEKIIVETSHKYIEAYEHITGRKF